MFAELFIVHFVDNRKEVAPYPSTKISLALSRFLLLESLLGCWTRSSSGRHGCNARKMIDASGRRLLLKFGSINWLRTKVPININKVRHILKNISRRIGLYHERLMRYSDYLQQVLKNEPDDSSGLFIKL